MTNTIECEDTNISEDLEHYIGVKYIIHGIYKELMVAKKDICYFEATKSRRIILKTHKDEYELLVKPLTYYKNLVNSSDFKIFVRNYLINLNHIAEMNDDYFILKNNIKISLGNDNRTKKISKEKYIDYITSINK